MLVACGGRASPSAPEAELSPLEHAAIGALAREACPRVLTRTFPLADAAGTATTGKLWVRRCTARALPTQLEIDVDVLGWQWVGAGSWGFDVREYVYFRASVRATLRVSVEVADFEPKLRVWSDAAPDVTVREIGRVSARADGPAARLLGVASGIFGQGPNVLATAALRDRVRDLIRARATHGLEIALADTPAPGTPGHARDELFSETEALFPGGALISGSFPADGATTLHYDVADGAVLARAVCVDEAVGLVDAVVAGSARPAAAALTDVLALTGHGEARIPAQPCPWVLVTGTRADTSASLRLSLSRAIDVHPAATRRLIRVTLRAYDVDGGEARLFRFSTGTSNALRSIGRPLTSARSPSVWLVADPIELRDGTPLVVEVSAVKPRARTFWSAETTYDETPLGRATIVGRAGESRAAIERDGHRIGWVELAVEAIEE